MRVIAGELGGRRLRAPRGRATRPTSDRVREALFSMLGALDGERVLDLFAGSGALGIEALSRGAGRAVFVERDRAALRALDANLRALGLLDGESARAEVRPGDARGVLGHARGLKETYDLLFIDPPYDRAGELGPELSEALAPLLGPAARVVVESDRRTPLELELPLARERRYGDTSIRIHQQR
ncbi:MAG TPA: 16S rRNA (guanine(966)-N(2))-methyltransferase RsmD [Solirubrobacteraceae bacterium]|nr:16S rRNA (guanine(966)-N(2))-methyltransferase RsmD [Solirubrobacteraceae bacterium]